MKVPLGEIARALEGSLVGDPEHEVSRVATVGEAQSGEICVVWDPESAKAVASSSASAFVTAMDLQVERGNQIKVADPRQALIALLEMLHTTPSAPEGIEEGARVAADVQCADSVYVSSGATVASGVVLGSRVQIHVGVSIGPNTVVEEDTVIHPNVSIYHGVRIGKRVIIHSGAVIGSDGFGYHKTGDGRRRKIPQIGSVEIEDDVEIGAGTTIDRATLGRTVIRRGTKIDNLVQIAHNCEIGEDCCIIGQAGIAGSSRVGRSTVIGAQSGISDHVTLGDGVRIGAQSGVADDLPGGDWIGSPAMAAARAPRVFAILDRLPEVYEEIRSLRRRCEELELEIAELRSVSE
jgi:UDP-3-O-[3-hydroxymyristoyl] glucosamine N-acyltransferase